MRSEIRGHVKAAQKQVKARRRRKWTYLSISFVISSVLLFFGLAWFSQVKFMTISSFEIEGANRVSEVEIKDIVDKHITGNYWGLFSKGNIFLYPNNSIKDELLALPTSYEVEIDTKGFHTISVLIHEREEQARWCNDISCFSVDENGFIFDESVISASSSSLITYRGGEHDSIGQYVLQTDDFKRIHFFIRELGGLSVEPREVVLNDAGYIDITLGKGGKLIVNTTDNLSSVLSNISTILNDKTIASSSSLFLESLDYMRLDSGNKVFYKFKE